MAEPLAARDSRKERPKEHQKAQPVHRSGRRRIGFRALAVLLGLLASALTGEVLARVIHGDRYAPRPVFLAFSESLGWRPTAGLDDTFYGSDFQIGITTGRRGERLGRLGEWRHASSLVITIGDSNTFGWGVSTRQTYPSQLEELLARVRPSQRVVNLGVGGYGTTQSALRLAELLDQPDLPPVDAVILLHTHNDFSDNVRFRAFQRGVLRPREVPPNGVASHLANWIRRSARALRGRAQRTLAGDHRRQDVLFNMAWERALPAAAEGEQTEAVRLLAADLLDPEQEQKATLAREAQSPLQAELLRQSLRILHDALPDPKTRVLHAVVYSAPQWYVDEVALAVAEEQTRDSRVFYRGRMPVREEFRGLRDNQHSGAHYTPLLNAWHANTFARWLAELWAPGATGVSKARPR